MIDFIRNIPIFQHFTKMRLSKLVNYHFKKVKFTRGQYVYKKGEQSKYVYIVFNGEFK